MVITSALLVNSYFHNNCDSIQPNFPLKGREQLAGYSPSSGRGKALISDGPSRLNIE